MMVHVQDFYEHVLREHGKAIADLFTDEINQWDRGGSTADSFYDVGILEIMKANAIERALQ